jgi:hypothetical protein
MNKFLALLALFVSFSANAGTGDSLGLSPFWDWKEIKTEHFHVVFPVELTKQAERVANLYEEAHQNLKKELQWEAYYRVNILVVDNADAANGATTPISRFGMILYLTPPDPFFSTNSYDDWLKLLVYHEYTHFLNMDATRGFWSAARYVFGDVLLPNSTWPSWMLEGYAVYIETKYTKTGRGRSPYWDGVLRTIVESKTLDQPETITLDIVNGGSPYFPSGEIPYLFGYHLMNTAERSKAGALSEMSFRGSYRFPYFINGNVENITGKDWYQHWDDWVKATNSKMDAQLAKIKSLPVSKTEAIDDTHDNSFGIAFSPDGKWAAYSSQSENHWQTLSVRPWRPGASPIEIEDKFMGSSLSFTPDSKRVVYSSLHQSSNYYRWSDLRVFDLVSGEKYWITDDARARDPDVSKDGKWITYTVASESGTDLMLGSLAFHAGRLEILKPKKIVDLPAYDRAANPHFSPDGKGIAFSWKVEGSPSEEIYYVPTTGGAPRKIIADGAKNRFPIFDSRGVLYFVSDRTGVENLYRRDNAKNTLITNVTGALWLPTFRGSEAFASVLSKRGFALSKVELFPAGIDPAKVTIEVGAEAPASVATVATHTDYPVENYSILSTLLPRQWAPLLIADNESTYAGAQIFGYDNTFRHQYFGFGAYDTTSKSIDYSVQYENRSFGPSLLLYGSRLTSNVRSSATNLGGPASFKQQIQSGLNLSFPFQQITSTFTPAFGISVDRNTYSEITGSTKRILYQLGARRYDLGSTDIYKGIFSHKQYLNLGAHTVLIPSLRAMKVSKRDLSYLEASALNQGKQDRVLNPLYSDSFDEFGIRGYPLTTISSLEAVTLGMDLKFPVAEIFRAWGTNPISFDQLSMQLFAEDTYRPSALPRYQHFASAGAGLRLGVNALLYIPLTLGLDYHYGFNETYGSGEVFFSVTTGSLLPF